MRQIFRNREHDLAFNRDGYFLGDALDPDTIKRLEDFFLLSTEQDFTGCQSSMELRSPDQKAKIYDFLSEIFEDRISEYIENYRSIAATFVSKKSDVRSVVRLHRDWAFVNEADYSSVGLWIPLCETDANNGALAVMKSSHQIKQNVRGSRIPSRINIADDLAAKYLTLLPMKPGGILFYDHRLIHGSEANLSGRTRTAASITLIPVEATPLHYMETQAGVMELEVDAGFYHHSYLTKATEIDPVIRYNIQTNGYRSRKVEYRATSIDEQDLIGLYEPSIRARLGKFKDRLKAMVSS